LNLIPRIPVQAMDMAVAAVIKRTGVLFRWKEDVEDIKKKIESKFKKEVILGTHPYA